MLEWIKKVLLAIIQIAGWFLKIRPVTDFRFYHFKEIDKMERYRGSWNPSPSGFVIKHQLVGTINAGPETVLVDNIPAAAYEIFVDFTTEQLGQAYSVWIRTFGDNGTNDDCNRQDGTINNQQKVQPVQNFEFKWNAHTD
jgi:hypothetical protein